MMVIADEYGAAEANTPVTITVLAIGSITQLFENSLLVVTKHLVLAPSASLIWLGYFSRIDPVAGRALTGVNVNV
jgi:hypothetical protein